LQRPPSAHAKASVLDDPVFADLVEVARDRTLVICAGPGVSVAAGLPGRARLLEHLLDHARARGGAPVEALREIENLAGRGQHVEALSAAKTALGEGEFGNLVQRELNDRRLPLPAIATAITALAPQLRAVLTTNLDHLLERAFRGEFPVLHRATGDLAQQRQYILKLHGTLMDRSTWVLTSDDHTRALYADPALQGAFAALFHACHLLFIGFDPVEEDLARVLAPVAGSGSDQGPRHFALMPAGAAAPHGRKRLEQAGVRLILYDSAAANPGEEARILGALAERASPFAQRRAGSDMDRASAITLLHLSDLQFGPHHRFESGGTLDSLLDRLRQDLDALRATDDVRPDLVLITGDLTEYGLKSQFEQVHRFAEGVAESVGLEPARVVLIPGNQDINLKACEAYFNECAANEEAPRPPYWPKLRHYADFFARFYGDRPGISFTEKEPWSFFEYPEIKVVVAGLNSTLADSHREEDHHGYLGEQQLRAFVDKLRPYKERGFLRIGVVHQDLARPPASNEAAEQDRNDLQRMLLPYLNLIVHGHIREDQIHWMVAGQAAVPLFGVSGAGVEAAERLPEVPRPYQLLWVQADRVIYGSRVYVPGEKRWIGDRLVDPKSRSGYGEKEIAWERAEVTFSSGGRAEAAPDAELAQIVSSYRHHIARTERRQTFMDKVGAAEGVHLQGGLDLLQIFIPQRVCRDAPHLSLPRRPEEDDEPKQLPEESALAAEERWREAEEERWREAAEAPRPVEEILTSRTERWVLVLGAPGAGKSALTRWLALKLCVAGESLGLLSPELVPVRIEMGAFDQRYRQARSAGRAYGFFDYLNDVHAEQSLKLCGDALERLAESQRLLWIFDALDEVTDPRARREYASMIIGLKDQHRGRGMLTSRIVGAQIIQPLLQEAGVASYTLLDFNEEAINAFLDRWYKLTLPAAPEEQTRRRERLRRTIDEDGAAHDLCRIPLLLTLIALPGQGGEMPRGRHRLYARAIDHITSQWDATRRLPNMASIRLDLSEKQRFLRRIARSMMGEPPGESSNSIQADDLLKIAVEFCREEYGDRPRDTACPLEADPRTFTAELVGEQGGEQLGVVSDNAARLVESLSKSNYVIVPLGPQAFGFTHITLLWYLAAADIHARFRSHELDLQRLKDMFRACWQSDAWEEVLTLICGMLEEDRPERVVELLQHILAEVPPFNHYVLSKFNAFSVRCLAEMGRLDTEPIRSFAVELARSIVHQADAFFVYRVDRLLSALRLCGHRWPEADSFRLWALSSDRVRKRANLRRTANEWAVATSTRKQRLPLLVDLLFGSSQGVRSSEKSGRDRLPREGESVLWVLSATIEQASKFGVWDSEEIAEFLAQIEQRSEPVRGAVLSALINTGVDSVALELQRLMNETENAEVRLHAARTLLKLADFREAAVAMLMRVASGTREGSREAAISELVGAVVSDPRLSARVIPLLSPMAESLRLAVRRELSDRSGTDEGRWIGYYLDKLRELSQVERWANRTLQEFLRDIDAIEAPTIRFYAAQLLARRGDEAAARRQFQWLANATELPPILRRTAAEALFVLPHSKAIGLEALVRMAQSVADRDSQLVGMAALEILAENDPSAQAELLKMASEGQSENVKLLAAQALVRTGPADDTARRRVLMDLATSANHQEIRLRAAISLRNSGAPQVEWQEILSGLMNSVTDEAQRLEAGKALGDKALLKDIAKRSRSQQVRKQVSEAATSLRSYEGLLRIRKKKEDDEARVSSPPESI
jgi:hypothetical protein